MYYYIPVEGKVEKHEDKVKVSNLMNKISPQWEDESSPMGTVFLGVYDWAFKQTENDLKLLIPNLVGGGRVPNNHTAEKLIGGSIYGDCFLLANDEDVASIDKRLASIV